MKRAIWLVPALVAAAVVLSAGPARASCAEPLPLQRSLDEAHAVFVGTVTGLDFQDRVATVAVDEVWKGEVAGRVTVSGGGEISYLERARAEGQEAFTSVDRTYAAGERYLFVSYAVHEGAYMDNQCSNTQVYGPALDEFRPADARVVEPPAPDRGTGLWIGLGAVAVFAISAILLVAIRRRRAPAAA